MALLCLSGFYGYVAYQELSLAWVLSQVKFIYDLVLLPNFLETHLSLRFLALSLDGYSLIPAIFSSLRFSDLMMAFSLVLVYGLALDPFRHRMTLIGLGVSVFKFLLILIVFGSALSSTSPVDALNLMHGLAFTLMLIHVLLSSLVLYLWIHEYIH